MRISLVLPLVYLLLPSAALAQPVAVGEIKGNGKEFTVQLTAEQIAGKKTVAIWYSSPTKSSMSEVFTIKFQGPVGTKVTTYASKPRRTMTGAFNSKRNWWSVPLMLVTGKQKATASILKSGETESGGSTSDPWAGAALCKTLKSSFPQIRALLLAYTGKNYTDSEICDFLKSQGGNNLGSGGDQGTTTGDSNVGTLEASGLLYKDTCSSGYKYPVRFDLDLSALDATLYPQGTTLTAKVTTVKFTGKRSAKLKEKSDGKYGPHPILITAMVSYGDMLKIVRFKSTGPKVTLKSETDKFIYRFGTVYDVIPHIEGGLTGGKATFVIQNGESVYSLCFRAVKQNQTVNGYH